MSIAKVPNQLLLLGRGAAVWSFATVRSINTWTMRQSCASSAWARDTGDAVKCWPRMRSRGTSSNRFRPLLIGLTAAFDQPIDKRHRGRVYVEPSGNASP